ncbi:MAG: multidrug ABC transporter ATP-binding protein [Actinobacteria bacterium 13_2_20CM_2_71_6]|nr:MAG: multidrug ABC transporter ATP-binding protein [Actinobacteria bacterium 13_2_20CM_2_71_6]
MTNAVASSAIEVRGLSRRFGGPHGFEAVRDVSFSVERGELFALLGTNGAGKTSTLEVIEGLARPSGGSVRVLGHDPYARRAAVRPRMGVMLQEGGFPPELSVAGTARMWAGTLTDPRPVAEALDLVDLSHRATVRVKQLSGGERRRLDLALAILGRPEVLVLDEPTTGLDPQSRGEARRLIRSLLLHGTTVLLTTHYLEDAQELADRLAIMHRGRIVVAGSVADVVAAYPARVSFVLPPGVDPGQLPAVPGTRALDLRDGRVTVHTDALQRTVTALLSWANQRGVDLGQLDARSASLEEAFLSIAANDKTTEVPA